MAALRPTLSVYNVEGAEVAQVATPAVFGAPLRVDIVHEVHTNMSKNSRQPYAVDPKAGTRHSAESWGTGRAVARIPRVSGSGTGRAGQAAFGNMVRKGRMFQPTRTFRRWHRHVNVNQKRFAVVSALAASAVPALVMARGHAVGNVPEVPLVVEDAFQKVTKTSQALEILKKIGAGDDVARAAASRRRTTGIARRRNRVHSTAVGPLVVVAKDEGISKAVRALPGVKFANVYKLNLLDLAPGATVGRFIVWTKSAIEALNDVFGTETTESKQKGGYTLPAHQVVNPDFNSLIFNENIAKFLRPRKARQMSKAPHRFNNLTNFRQHVKLNPYAVTQRYAAIYAVQKAKKYAEELKAAKAKGEFTEKQRQQRALKAGLKAIRKTNLKNLLTGSTEASTFDKEAYQKKLAQVKKIPVPAPSAKKAKAAEIRAQKLAEKADNIAKQKAAEAKNRKKMAEKYKKKAAAAKKGGKK